MLFDHPLPRFPLTSVLEYRLLAKKRLPRHLFEFLDGGAFEEVTKRQNSEDFQRLQLRRPVLKDVSNIALSTTVLGQHLNFPLILAPVGFAGMFAKRGEVQAAKAASKAGIPFSLSKVGVCSMEEIAQDANPSLWIEFNMLKDRNYALEYLQRAKAVGCVVLFLTVDLPVVGARYRYDRVRRASKWIHFLEGISHPRWWIDVCLQGGPVILGNIPHASLGLYKLADMRRWVGSQVDRTLSWKDFEWIRSQWPNKIVIKGILEPSDAQMAKDFGADGIVVSNHGARHIDGTSSTIAALPAIVDAVDNELEILIDGGITSGLDILKALALGANACMVGKAWAYGLAARGEKGVDEVLSILRNELNIAMAHFGLSSISEINRSLVLNCINGHR